MIAKHLDRKDLKALRLVNHEFYRSFSGYYLQQLVIRVGDKLCATLNKGASSAIDSTTSDVANTLSNGNRVLGDFGDQIRRFALVLELTESQLVSPTITSDDIIEVRPWGMYRWPAPSKPSEDFTLEGMAESLEKSQGLFGFLTHLRQVRELALSCDGGLGYIQSPDVQRHFRLPAIFGDGKGPFEVLHQLDFEKPYALEKIEWMIRHSNLSTAQIDLAHQLLQKKGVSLEELSGEQGVRCPLPDREREHDAIRSTFAERGCCRLRSKTLRLQPDMLTQSQKQFLLQRKYRCKVQSS